MNGTRTETIQMVFSDVLGQFAYMLAEPTAKEDLPHSTRGYRAVAIDFSGDVSGRMTLTVPTEMCRELAANALGTEPDGVDAQEHGLDALKEALNISCAHILTSVGSPTGNYKLGLPTETKAGPRQWRRQVGSRRCIGFIVDSTYATLLSVHLPDKR